MKFRTDYNFADDTNLNTSLSNKKIKKLIKKYSKQYAKHFKEYGFDIDAYIVYEDFLQDIFNVHLDQLLYKSICEASDTTVVHSGKNGHTRTLLVKKDGYYPVYYNIYEDKIIIIDDVEYIDSKKYIFDHRESDGYIQLGCL